MVIIDIAVKVQPDVRVFTLDTGRLPQETYDLVEQVRGRYGVRVEMLAPEAVHVEEMVRRHGPNLMYRSVDLRLLCCQVRKVLPLTLYLASLDAWITGLRREQWASRARSARSSWTTTTEASSSSIRWPTGPSERCGTTSGPTTSRTTLS